MDSWDKFNETSILEKEVFYCELNKEGISDEDYAHYKEVFKEYCKNMSDCHDLYVQSDTLLLTYVSENFRNICIKNYELDPSYFYSLPGLAWKACLKKTKVELELITDNDMLLMIEEGIRGGICQASYRYAKANNKYIKNYNKSIVSSYLSYLDVNNLYGWPICKKLPINGFKWIEELSKFNDDFIKNYDENSDVGYFLEVDIEYPKKLSDLHKDLPFLPKRKKN